MQGYTVAQADVAEVCSRVWNSTEIEMRKQAVNATDEFSSIRGLWAGCAACHGQQGEVATFPKLAGQNKDYIIDRLTTYKNRGQVGTMSSTMLRAAKQVCFQNKKYN